MLRHYTWIAFRNLLNNKVFSTINILGLAVGMSIAILIGLWVWDEISFNHYFKNHASLGEVASIETFNGVTSTEEFSSVPIAAALRNNYPEEIKQAALIKEFNAGLVVGENKMNASGYWAESEFPGMLTLRLKNGSFKKFIDPYSILISESLAQTLFGKLEPVGKVISFNNEFQLKVSGVYPDFPSNTDFRDVEFLAAWNNKNNIGNRLGDDWNDHHFYRYPNCLVFT